VTILIHVAGPRDPSVETTYDLQVNPVITSTEAVIEGAKLHKVRKIVVTSSALTALGDISKPEGSTYDENDVTEIDKKSAYRDGKIIEEEMFLKFAKEQDSLPADAPKCEVVII